MVQSDGAGEDSSVSIEYPSSDDREDGRSKKFDYSRLGTQSLSGSLTDLRQHLNIRSPSQPVSVFDRLGTTVTAVPRASQSPVSVYSSPRGGLSSSSESESVSLSGLG